MAAQSQIKNVVFDLGGVLIDWNPRYMLRKIIKDEAFIEEFLRDVCNHEWNEQQDAGRPFAEAVAERIAKFPQHKSLIEAYHQRWVEMLGQPFQEGVEVLAQLHQTKSHRIFGLSNWSAETFPIALEIERFQFLRWFETVLVSGTEKLIKPDPKFFALLTSRHGVKPVESVFIDDVKKNVDAARSLGFHTVHLQDPAQIRAQLRPFGIL